MIALGWDNLRAEGVLLRDARGSIARDDGLATAVLLSLFLDARAAPDDGATDRRGWLGDALSPVPGDRIGSRLWLLAREKQTDETLRRAEDYAAEALAWLVEDRLAESVEVAAVWASAGAMRLAVTARPSFFATFEARL
jgi:phage gp46-like protein